MSNLELTVLRCMRCRQSPLRLQTKLGLIFPGENKLRGWGRSDGDDATVPVCQAPHHRRRLQTLLLQGWSSKEHSCGATTCLGTITDQTPAGLAGTATCL